MFYGCAVGDAIFVDDAFANLVARECNMLVCEGAMKFRTLCPSPWAYDFAAADLIMEFAARHEMSMRGHALVWGANTLPWFEEAMAGPDRWSAYERYVSNVVTHFRGRVDCWDVVNEPMSENEDDPTPLKPNVFLANLGPDYINLRFRDPDCP